MQVIRHRFGIVAISLAVVASFLLFEDTVQATGQTADTDVQVLSTLYPRVQSPLSIYIHGVPDSFLRKLERLNREIPVFEPLNSGQQPLDATIWLFALDKMSDGDDLPGVVGEVFRLTSAGTRPLRNSYLEFTLSNGDQKAAMFLFAEHYPQDGSVDVGCLMAADTFEIVHGTLSRL